MARLPAPSREVLLLINVVGLSYEEAAHVIGCPIGTVRSRLNRAQVMLAVEMGEAADRARRKKP